MCTQVSVAGRQDPCRLQFQASSLFIFTTLSAINGPECAFVNMYTNLMQSSCIDDETEIQQLAFNLVCI